MKTQSESNQICCPKFDPAPWDDKIFKWKNKKFIKDSVFTIFHIPVTFGRAMKRLDAKVTKAGSDFVGSVCLSEHASKWNMNLYLAVDKKIPDAVNTEISGRFFSKVYEGSFSNFGKWCDDFESITEARGLKIKKWYFWYTTCPKCAKKYGKNYVVIISQIQD